MPTIERNPVVSLYPRITTTRTFCDGHSEISVSTPFVGTCEPDYFYKKWVQTPGYLALKKAGSVLPDNRAEWLTKKSSRGDKYRFSTSYAVGTCTSTNPTVETHRTVVEEGEMERYARPSNTLSPELPINSVYFKLVDAVKRDQFQAPVFLIEARKTSRLITEAASTLVRAFLALKRGNIAYFLDMFSITRKLPKKHRKKIVREFNRDFGRDASGTAARTLLKHSYGWTPLLSEVHNAALVLEDIFLHRPGEKICSVTARARLERKLFSPTHIFTVSPYIQGYRDRVIKESRKVTWRFSYKSRNSLTLAQLGLSNPLGVLWEATPLSFVADWFLPIGAYLNSLDVPDFVDHKGGTSGYRQEILDKYEIKQHGSYSAVSGKGSAHTVSVERLLLTGPPVPKLSSLTFDPKIGAKRALNAVALLRVLLLKG